MYCELSNFNSLAPGRFQFIFRKVIFKLILENGGCDISSKITLRWTSLDLSDNKSTLDQVMAWCRQATSHYLNQCWPRSLPPYGVTRPQCVNWLRLVMYMNWVINFQVMAWCQLSAKPSSESGNFKIFNSFIKPDDAYMHLWTGSSLVQVMAWNQTGAKLLPEPMLTSCQLDP